MVRMIDLIKHGEGGAEEEPEEGQSSSEKEGSPLDPARDDEPLRFPSPEEFARGGFPSDPAGRKKKDATPPPTAPSRDRGSLLQGDLEESKGSGIRTPKKLEVKQRYCPYLGGRIKRTDVKDFPVATNVCYAQESEERKLLRTITLPYSAVSAQRQREFCLSSSSYPRCVIFQAKEKSSGG